MVLRKSDLKGASGIVGDSGVRWPGSSTGATAISRDMAVGSLMGSRRVDRLGEDRASWKAGAGKRTPAATAGGNSGRKGGRIRSWRLARSRGPWQSSRMRVLGFMTGTSLDAVDMAILETDGETIAAF